MKKLVIICCLLLGACTTSNYDFYSTGESSFTMDNWRLAVENRKAERYELAYHYYSIALSSARAEPAVLKIKSEMESLERTIQAVR